MCKGVNNRWLLPTNWVYSNVSAYLIASYKFFDFYCLIFDHPVDILLYSDLFYLFTVRVDTCRCFCSHSETYAHLMVLPWTKALYFAQTWQNTILIMDRYPCHPGSLFEASEGPQANFLEGSATGIGWWLLSWQNNPSHPAVRHFTVKQMSWLVVLFCFFPK